jgi:hypothetical protein
MSTDQSQVTARISFEGLFVFCFNDKKQCEIGVIKHVDHVTTLNIMRIDPDGRVNHVEHELKTEKDIWIEVVNPAEQGAFPYTPGEFDRRNEKGDDRDFRWIPDLEGPEFHNKNLTIYSANFKSIMRITDGRFYTMVKPREIFARETVGSSDPPKYFGRVAEVVGVDIVCRSVRGSGVSFRNEGKGGISTKLPQKDGTKYEITIKNTRVHHIPGAVRETQSDFRLYYDVARDPEGTQYDLCFVVPAGDTRSTKVKVTGTRGYERDRYPYICDPVQLSGANGFPE